MKAVVYDEYGAPDVLKLGDVETPRLRAHEVLIRVRAAAVNPYDWHFMRGAPYFMRVASGLMRPKSHSLGVDVAGVVDEVGAQVVRFRPGDEVFGTCRGAFAEVACAEEERLAAKPANISFAQAASATVAGLTALQALRKGGMREGARVLVNGASGGVGTFAVQIARAAGAIVTGVCSTRNVAMVAGLGAERVIDYTREDFTRERGHDLLLDCVGNRPFRASLRPLREGGVYVAVGAPSGRWIQPLPRVLGMVALSPFVSRKLAMPLTRNSTADLEVLRALLESGRVVPVIDRTYRLDQVREAIGYLEAGHARGKVVLTV